MKISVVIATRNRAYALTDCLNAAAAAFAFASVEDAELVVVDNGSSDNTSEVINAWAYTAAIKVQLITELRKGVSHARNAGMQAAKGALLVFIDDDCRMSESYISELLEYDRTDQQLVMRSGSVILGDPTDLPLTVKRVSETLSWQRPMSVEQEGALLGGALIGCNMAMRKELADRIGFFDTRLGAGADCPAGEDTDYFYRGYLAGARLEMVPNMIVSHFHGRKKIEDSIKLFINYTTGNGALALKYLFIYPNFSRHIIWELKNCIPYVLGIKKASLAAGKISHKDRLYCLFKGCYLFTLASVKRLFKAT